MTTLSTVWTFLVFLKLAYCQENLNSFPPLLNVSKPFVDVPPNTSLTIECRGRKEVTWHYPSIEKWESPDKIITSEKNDGGTNYISLLYVPPSYVYTGLYICSYKNPIRNGAQRNASVYVFMNDPHRLFVPQNEFNTTMDVPLNAGSHLFVHCLPTNSKINVTLWQHFHFTTEVKRLFTNDMIMFDPTKGFLVRQLLSRNVSCRGHWNNFQESTSIFMIQASNDSVPKPLIEGTTFDWQLGQNYCLNCSAVIRGEAGSKLLKWTHPNFNDVGINMKEGKDRRQSYVVLFLILNITLVEKTHEGIYSCSLIENNGNDTMEISSDQTYVTVHAAKQFEPVRFDRALHASSVIVEEPGESITFSANVVNYRLNDIEIHWEKNGLLLQESSKYKFVVHSMPVSLSVNNLQMSDAGKYSLFGRKTYQYTTGNISFLLAIKSTPEVQILPPNVDKFYEAGNSYSLKCQVKSFPQPNITWMWKGCISWELCESAQRTIITDTATVREKQLENEMYHVSSDLDVTRNNSGILYCKAVNSVGENESSVPFILTDNFGGEPVTLTVNDRNPDGNSIVKVKCQITSMVYGNITWFFVQVPGNYNMVDVKTLPGIEITPAARNSEYSQVSLVTFNAKKDRSGLYVCMFLDKRTNKQKYRFVGVFVNQDVKPSPTPVTGGNDVSMSSTTVAIVISVVVVIAVIIIITIVVVAVKIKRKNSRFNTFYFQEGQLDLIDPNIPLEEQVELLPYDPGWEFPKDRLKLGRVIGHGAFGRVVKADAIGLDPVVPFTTVAVKMLRDKNDETQYKALMGELKIMIHLGRHVNILNLKGAVTKNLFKGELMVMVEYCCHGNLRSYLLKRRDKFVNQIDPKTGMVNPNILHENTTDGENKRNLDYSKPIALGISNPVYNYSSTGQLIISTSNDQSDATRVTTSAGSSVATGDTSFGNESGYSSTGEAINFAISGKEAARYSGILTTSDLLCYSFQSAQGMSYLASRKLLHRDLAARNILLAEGNVIKISDFGLSKDVYKYSKYIKKSDGPLPVKWMAIESIKDRIFTTKSDVWSFGVLMWEIFTLGGNPYPGFEMNEGFFKRLQEGYRLEKPPYSPDNVYRVMLDCWNSNPKDRPDFTFLGEQLGGMLESAVMAHYVDLNTPYASLNNDLKNLEDYLSMGVPNYLELQDTNVDENTSAQDKPSYCNIPPTFPEQAAIKPTLDLKNANNGTDVSIDRMEVESKAVDENMPGEKNVSAHSNSSTSIGSGKNRADESKTKNPDYLVMA